MPLCFKHFLPLPSILSFLLNCDPSSPMHFNLFVWKDILCFCAAERFASQKTLYKARQINLWHMIVKRIKNYWGLKCGYAQLECVVSQSLILYGISQCHSVVQMLVFKCLLGIFSCTVNIVCSLCAPQLLQCYRKGFKLHARVNWHWSLDMQNRIS